MLVAMLRNGFEKTLIEGIAMKNSPSPSISQQFIVMSPTIIWIITTVFNMVLW